ncbi:phospholipid carrier-dependent glycosyltransferase [Candidatus Beckwithbacteria bacterium]|nr:phospholipid carrier-dependent glycosyltransferase [Candidatus Beckwithbacteria bacterium]
MKFKREILFLSLIVLLALVLRLYRITNPVGDWHAFRQADTASVTLQYVKNGIDLLKPTYLDLSNIQSGQDNLMGYRMVEFPLINVLIAQIILFFPILQSIDGLVLLSRLFAIFFSLGTLVSLYFLTKELSGKKVALLTAFSFAVLPYSIYYSRVILPEPYFLFFSTFSILQFLFYLKTKKLSHYLLSLTILALAFLLKPFVGFLVPVYFVSIYFYQKDFYKDWKIYLFPVLALAPLLWWRQWILQFPTGIPASDWLLNGNKIRLRPAWFRWLFYERLIKLFLGFSGTIFILANLTKFKKDFWIYLSWWLGILLYFIVVATGNVQHDYYQNLALPILSISLGRGIYYFYEKAKSSLKDQKIAAILLTILLFGSAWYLSWEQVKGYFNVNHWEYVKAGKKANELLPVDAKVIAPAMGDTQFLFQTQRQGWPIGYEISKKIANGAQFYISTSNDDERKMLLQYCKLFYEQPEFMIIDLRNCTDLKD